MDLTVSKPESKFVQYIRDKHNNPRGIMVAVVDKPAKTVKIGYSLCSPKDRFNKEFGLELACKRAEVYFDQPPEKIESKLPHTVKRNIARFINRCSRYSLKNELIVPAWANIIYPIDNHETFKIEYSTLKINDESSVIN